MKSEKEIKERREMVLEKLEQAEAMKDKRELEAYHEGWIYALDWVLNEGEEEKSMSG